MKTIRNLFVPGNTHPSTPDQHEARSPKSPMSNISPTAPAIQESRALRAPGLRFPTLRRLVSLPAMRMQNRSDPQLEAQIVHTRGEFEEGSSSNNAGTTRINEAEANAVIDEAVDVLEKGFTEKNLAPMSNDELRNLIIHRYAERGIHSIVEIAEHLSTTSERAPQQPDTSAKAREKFRKDVLDRRQQLEAQRRWQSGLSDVQGGPFDEFIVPEGDEDPSMESGGRESLERSRSFSENIHVSPEPIKEAAELAGVDALLKALEADRHQGARNRDKEESGRKLRATKSSIDLFRESATPAKRGNEPGKLDLSGGIAATANPRLDPRFPKAPPVPFLPGQNGEA